MMNRESTIATYIRRFRGPPTSREEREKTRKDGEKDFWWVDKSASFVRSKNESIDSQEFDRSFQSDIPDDSSYLNVSRSSHDKAMSIDELILESPPTSPIPPPPESNPEHSREEILSNESQNLPTNPVDSAPQSQDDDLSALSASLSSSASCGMEVQEDTSFQSDSFHSSVGSPWYAAKPEDVLVEDPEITIQRLRTRLGLTQNSWRRDDVVEHTSPIRQELTFASLPLPSAIRSFRSEYAFNDALDSLDPLYGDRNPSRRSSPSLLEPTISSLVDTDCLNGSPPSTDILLALSTPVQDVASVMTGRDTGDVHVENIVIPDATEQEDGAEGIVTHTMPNEVDTTGVPNLAPIDEVADPISENIQPSLTPTEPSDTTSKGGQVGIAFRRRQSPLPPFHPSALIDPEPLQFLNEVDKKSSDVATQNPITTISNNESITDVENVMNNLVSTIVQSWADSGSTLVSSTVENLSPLVIDNEFSKKETEITNNTTNFDVIVHVDEVHEEKVNEMETLEPTYPVPPMDLEQGDMEDMTPTRPLESKPASPRVDKASHYVNDTIDEKLTLDMNEFTLDEMEDFDFLDDDVVRMLLQRILVCEEALAILRAREVLDR